MSLMTKEKLEALLDREVDRAHILIAGNVIHGLDEDTIAQIIGCTVQEIQAVTASDEYKEIYTLISANANESRLETNAQIEEIERKAWTKLGHKLERETDIDVIARVAAMANKAVRRIRPIESGGDVLRPHEAGQAVRLSLSKRMIQHVQDGKILNATENSILIEGTKLNPTFDQIKKAFGGTGAIAKLEEQKNHTSDEDFSFEAMVRELKG